jgi:hypothetical protein
MANDIGDNAKSLIPVIEEIMFWDKLNVVLVPEKCLCLLLGNNQVAFFECFQIQFDLEVTDDTDRHEIKFH